MYQNVLRTCGVIIVQLIRPRSHYAALQTVFLFLHKLYFKNALLFGSSFQSQSRSVVVQNQLLFDNQMKIASFYLVEQW